MKDTHSPRDIAWGLITDLYLENSRSEDSLFIPFATSHSGIKKIFQQNPATLCYQTFKPEVDELKKQQITCVQEIPQNTFEQVLFVPTKQRVESLGLLAHLILNLKIGGRLFFCCHNMLGAGGFNSKIKEVFPDLEIESSKKCRYFILKSTPLCNEATIKLNAWIDAAAPSQVTNTDYTSIPGIFGWNKTDKGSELLLSTLPELQGKGADLGAGYGFLSHQILSRCKNVSSIALVEAEQRSLICAKDNLEEYKSKCSFHWFDVCSDETRKTLGPFDWIVMNPPFHDESLVDQDLGKEFIKSSSLLLKKGGSLYMVANEFLAYEKVLKELFTKVEMLSKQNGFKVFHVKR